MHANFMYDIREGMKVFDNTNKQIGTVEWVKFGDDDPLTPEPEVSDVNPIERQRHNTLIENIADAFRSDDIPDEVREKLLLQGFVRIDAEGLFAGDRYVTPEQIERVSKDKLMLNVSKKDLLKRH